jgi:PTS system N-acetylglucosamine-specific IIC component
VGTEADQVAGEMKAALRAASGAGATAAASLLTALGGRENVRAVETASTRLRINIVDPAAVNESAIASLGLRGVARAAPNWLHVIVGPEAAAAGASLRQLL